MLRSRFPDLRVRTIIVNDGSVTNVSSDVVKGIEQALGDFEWITYDVNQGKGFALRTGVAVSKAEYILYTDIDFPYTVESTCACLNAVIHEGGDLAVAIRNRTYYDSLPASRRLISKALKRLNRTIFRLEISDTQGGLKVFNRSARNHFLETTIDRYLFDLEFVYLCSRDTKTKVAPVECALREGILMTPVKAKILRREGLNFLRLWLGGLG